MSDQMKQGSSQGREPMGYEPPRVAVLGSVADLTQESAKSIPGNDVQAGGTCCD